jgi:hypothetical protein
LVLAARDAILQELIQLGQQQQKEQTLESPRKKDLKRRQTGELAGEEDPAKKSNKEVQQGAPGFISNLDVY